MAHTKQLLDNVNADKVDELVNGLHIEKRNFTDDNGRRIDYNKLVVSFANGDTAEFKFDALSRAAFFYALAGGTE